MITAGRNLFISLLRRSERYTKTDMVYLASGGIWLALDAIAGGIIALLLAIAFAHYLPKEVYGTYRFLIATFWILTAFTMTGLPTAILRSVAKQQEGAYRSSFLYSVLWSLPLSVIALGISGYYFFNGNETLGVGLLCIALLGPFIQAAYLWGTFLLGKKEFPTLAVCGIIFAFVPAFSLFLTVLVSPNPLVLLLVYFLSSIFTGGLLILFTFLHFHPNKASGVEYKKIGGHFSAMNLLGTLAQQVDKLIVFHYLGAVNLAVYMLAVSLPEQIKSVFDSLSTLALPKFVARPLEEVRANFWKRLWLYTAFMVMVAVAYMVVAPLVFKLLFPAYLDAVFYSQLYALTLIPIGAALPVALLQAHMAKRPLYIYNVLSPTFQIIALVILTSQYGLAGAVAARVAARFWGLVLGSVLVKNYREPVANK